MDLPKFVDAEQWCEVFALEDEAYKRMRSIPADLLTQYKWSKHNEYTFYTEGREPIYGKLKQLETLLGQRLSATRHDDEYPVPLFRVNTRDATLMGKEIERVISKKSVHNRIQAVVTYRNCGSTGSTLTEQDCERLKVGGWHNHPHMSDSWWRRVAVRDQPNYHFVDILNLGRSDWEQLLPHIDSDQRFHQCYTCSYGEVHKFGV